MNDLNVGVLSLVEEDRAIVFEDMIEDMALETGKHVDTIINELARHYEIEERTIINLLKSINSRFIEETNRIIGFIDEEPIKRTTYHMACKRIFEKLVKGFRRNDLFDGANQDHINFLTESIYSYLKEKCDGTATSEV